MVGFGGSIDLGRLIDRRSFMLGMITAFGECVGGEAKKCAFSPPFYPDDYYLLKTDAERIASELSIHLWLEENAEIAEEKRVMWWVIYKFPEVLDEYHRLRAEGHNPAFEFDAFGDLLSYGYAFGDHSENVSARMRTQEDTMGDGNPGVLFQPGDWPGPGDGAKQTLMTV